MLGRIAVLVTLAALSVAALTAGTASAAIGDTVTGNGTECSGISSCDFVVSFSFSAVVADAAGNATGTLAFSSLPSAGGPPLNVFTGHIVCATFVAGRVALEGVLDTVANSSFRVGDEISWWVQDIAGPSGPAGLGDKISDRTVGRGLACGDFSEVNTAGLRSGDIVIAPGGGFSGVTQRLPDGGVALFGDNGVAHRLNADPQLMSQLIALVGSRVHVYGRALRTDIANTPIQVDDFRIDPGGALNGEQVTVSGPLRRIADGSVIITDQFGHGHRLTGIPDSTLASLLGRPSVTFGGRALVTNAASRINWPIAVETISGG